MNCPNCKTRNPIGSNFCRQCGAELALVAGSLAEEEARRVEQERINERLASLLARAFALSERDKVDEAIPLAEEAATLAPGSTAAHGLCATLYERAHRSDEAIAAMARVVELNPDSAVDRDKLDRMRRGVHWMPRHEVPADKPERPRWLAAAAGAAVCVVVLAIGLSIVANASRDRVTEKTISVGKTLPPRTNTTLASPAQNNLYVPPVTAQADTGAYKPDPSLLGAQPGGDPFQSQGFRPAPQASTGASNSVGKVPIPLTERTGGSPNLNDRLPPLGGDSGRGNVPPVMVPVPLAGNGAIPAGPPANAGTSTPAGPPSGSGSGDSGYIRIQVNPPPVDERPTGAPRGDENRGEDPQVKAQSLQASGRYREALAAYQSALAQGADPAESNQGIALCHQRLGEDTAAKAAYRRALAAYESQMNTDRRRFAERGISACRAALEVLGG